MQITFLGTGAAEGVPAVFSRTDEAMRIRKSGGRNLRTRNSLRIGNHHQIDFSPDNFWQMHRCGLDMYDIDHILITHSHEDHFVYDQIIAKEMPAGTNGRPLNIYLSTKAADWLERQISCSGLLESVTEEEARKFRGRYPVHPLDHGKSYRVGSLELFTLPGNHRVAATGERSINYLITFPNGDTLLYALDTGYYTDDTWEMLTGRHIDTLIMDCTFGGRTDRGEFPAGHLDASSFLKAIERMKQIGCLDTHSTIYATHINPDQGLDHEGLTRFFDASPHEVVVAYDTLSFELGGDEERAG